MGMLKSPSGTAQLYNAENLDVIGRHAFASNKSLIEQHERSNTSEILSSKSIREVCIEILSAETKAPIRMWLYVSF
jgi:hypothetical protein